MLDRKLPSMDRRDFLAGVVAAMGWTILPAGRATTHEACGATSALQGLFADLDGAMAVGRHYLERHPDEASRPWLARNLFGAGSPLEHGELCRGRGAAGLRDRCERDFRSGDLVVVEGWFLARTEARLLALLSLLPA